MILLLLIIDAVWGGPFPLVTTPNGVIQGTHSRSYKGLDYSQFIGVPYAQPPVGNLRFKDPGTCIEMIQHNPHPEGGNLIGQEDCLYLNIFVPRTNPQSKDQLDVIVHVHGGAFNFGYGNNYAGPKLLMDIDVILVTMNYRLGPLGFLSTEDEVVPGNLGMKDQVESLKWIQSNIEYFGGNPKSVTLTGLSAGGASVHYHYLSPLSEGLFHRGISISGSALCPWSFQEGALEKTRQVGGAVGCFQNSTAELIECLRQRPAEQIVNSVRMFRPWLYNPFSPFGVVKETEGSKPFLNEHPYEILLNGKATNLPWLVSVTSEEGLYPAADYLLKDNYLIDLENRWLELAASVLDYNYTLPLVEHASVAKLVKELIILSGRKTSPRKLSKNWCSDRRPRHFYNTEEISTFSVYYTKSEARNGVCHGDDVMFIMSKPLEEMQKMTARDESIKDVMLKIWESFIKTGIPKVNDAKWVPLSKSVNADLDYLHIKSPEHVQMEINKGMGHPTFWNAIPFKENEKLLS
ncbi:hypothetical protein FQR65_LT18484 [Abscondita terminalis]|nr:hypothetical protein FQR65_LT18484 [Abscondita terminalis]